MKPAKFLVFSLLVLEGYSPPVLGQDARVTVKIVDKQKTPVVGTVILNPGRLRVGKTKSDGQYTFNHNCQTGQTLKAEPEDAAKYYNSEERVCSKTVLLEVFPRPRSIGALTDVFYIQEVASAPGPSTDKIYAGVFGVVTDKVERVSGDKAKCKLTIDKKFTVAYYNAKMSDWKAVTGAVPQASVQPDVIYYFPNSCEDASRKIVEIKRQSNFELRTGVHDYFTSNSREIGTAVVEAAKPPK